MISGGNATVYVRDLDSAIDFYVSRLGLKLTNRFGQHWATVQTGPSYWTTREAGAGLTIGLHPHSSKHAAPGTPGGVGFGLETYGPSEQVSARLAGHGVRVDPDIVRFEAGNVFNIADQDGLPTYVHEFPPFMLEGAGPSDEDRTDDGPFADTISGGHAIVYVSNMDASLRFYAETLGMKLTNRFGDHFATVEAGRLVLAIHPKTPRTPDPGTKGSVALGLTIDEPIERVVSRLSGRGVRITGAIVRTETNRFIEFEDPDGNLLYLAEPAPQENPASRLTAGSHA
jgi:catechol 2,3-dioxygenase-like lactoylglutathione lyase family enzyme